MLAGGLVLLGAGAAVTAHQLRPLPRLPAPTGPYAIGTTRRHCTDPSRPEPFGPDPSAERALTAQIWYPANGATVSAAAGPPAAEPAAAEPVTTAAGNGTGLADPYLDGPEHAAAIAALLGAPAAVMSGLDHGRTHARQDVRPAPGRFPVLVHLNGFAGGRGLSRAWVEDVVSHGYIVVGLDQAGTSAYTELPDGAVVRAISKDTLDPLMPLAVQADPDGRHAPAVRREVMPEGIIPFLAEDASAALDMMESLGASDPLLAGHLDTERAGIFGISLGGYTAGEAARRDERFRACLVADAGQRAATASAGITQPLMVMTRDAEAMRRERKRIGGWPEAEIRHTVGTERALAENSHGPAWYAEMNDLHHLNWTDLPLWTPLATWAGMGGPAGPQRATAAIREGTHVFFDHALGDDSADDVTAFADHHANTHVQTYRV